jgi:hypothetical protein
MARFTASRPSPHRGGTGSREVSTSAFMGLLDVGVRDLQCLALDVAAQQHQPDGAEAVAASDRRAWRPAGVAIGPVLSASSRSGPR